MNDEKSLRHDRLQVQLGIIAKVLFIVDIEDLATNLVLSPMEIMGI